MTAAAADIELFTRRMEAAGFSHDQAAVLAALLAEEQARVLAERPATRRDIDELQTVVRAGSNGADMSGTEGRLDRIDSAVLRIEEEFRGQLGRIESSVKAESVRLEVEVRQSETRLESRISRIRGGVVGWVIVLFLLQNALLAGAARYLGLWHP